MSARDELSGKDNFNGTCGCNVKAGRESHGTEEKKDQKIGQRLARLIEDSLRLPEGLETGEATQGVEPCSDNGFCEGALLSGA